MITTIVHPLPAHPLAQVQPENETPHRIARVHCLLDRDGAAAWRTGIHSGGPDHP